MIIIKNIIFLIIIIDINTKRVNKVEISISKVE